MKLQTNQLTGKKIVVLGGGGFIGGHDIDQTEEFNGVRRAVDELIGSKNVILYNVGWASWMHRVS